MNALCIFETFLGYCRFPASHCGCNNSFQFPQQLTSQPEHECHIVSVTQKGTRDNLHAGNMIDDRMTSCASLGYNSRPWIQMQFNESCALRSIRMCAQIYPCTGTSNSCTVFVSTIQRIFVNCCLQV